MSKTSTDGHMSDEQLQRFARLYYVWGYTQEDIADQMGIGRSSVARYLSEARTRGIVRFHVVGTVDQWRNAALEEEMIRTFNLRDCVVFDTQRAGQSLELLTAGYLDTVLPMVGEVGLGWGHTLFTVGSGLDRATPHPELRCIQMTGGSGVNEEIVPASHVSQKWAHALRAGWILLPAPGIVHDPILKDYILQDPSVGRVLDLIASVSLAVVGIGQVSRDSTIIASGLAGNLEDEILSSSAVGDILFHFYDECGQPSLQRMSARVVGISREKFRSITTRIGIAYGQTKGRAILGALRGRYVNVLITDVATAQLAKSLNER